MFVIGDLLYAVARLLDFVLTIYMWIIIARALVSWVSPDPWNPIVLFLTRVTEPVLRPVRRHLPQTGIDFSPVVVILAIAFLQWFLVRALLNTASRLG